MGAKPSTNNNNDASTSTASGQGSRRTFSGVSPAGSGPGATASFTVLRPASSSNGAESSVSARQRARSLISVPNGHQPIGIPSSSASSGYSNAASGSPGTDSSTPEDSASGISQYGRGVFAVHSLPAQLLFNGLKCPVCNKFVLPDDVECHIVMCLTKPRINYNEDVLSEDKDECVICLEELLQGDTIARLPCLCIYHKSCIESWFAVNRSCPEHPGD